MPIVEVHCRTAPFDGGEPVEDVFVSVHPAGGGAALASGTTGAAPNQSGSVSLGVLAEGDYEIHITPSVPATLQGGSLQSIQVSGEDINVFDVLVDTSGLEPAPDAHFCRCSGTFKDPYGKAIAYLKIHVSECSLPQLIYYEASDSTQAIIPKSRVIVSDESGFASVDLLRGQTYSVYMEGFENLSRTVEVPDLAASPLPDVLFPVVTSIEYTHPTDGILNVQSPATSMVVGETLTLSVESVHRSGVRVEGLVSVSLDLDDDSQDLLDVQLLSGDLQITALEAGVASFSSSRNSPKQGEGVRSQPAPSLSGDLSVTILPE